MMGWFESIQFNLFCHHCFHGNTVHCLCIRICWRLWYFLYALFQMSCVFSSVECDVLIGVIWCENIHRCFSFNVVYAIYNVYVGIFPLCWILIADEVCHMPFDSVAFDLDWNDAIVSGWDFEGCLDNPNSWCTVSGCNSSFPYPRYMMGKIFSGYQFQIVFPCLVVCCIWWSYEEIWNLLLWARVPSFPVLS